MAAAAAAGDGEDPRWRRGGTDCSLFLASRFGCAKVATPHPLPSTAPFSAPRRKALAAYPIPRGFWGPRARLAAGELARRRRCGWLGAACEYRHCEGARINLRSCWYWFQGNCVNPSCTFRHPPLESFNRTKPFANPLSSHGSTSSKAANPCYFYYNSYCTKGDQCPFFHGPLTRNDAVGIRSEATTSNPIVNGNSVGVEMIELVKDVPENPAEDSSAHTKDHHSKGVIESRNPEFDGAISNASETSIDTGGHMKSSMPTPSDQSSEHSAMDHTEEDECGDSSPGFDVLVDDEPSNKSDLELQLAQERDADVLYVKYDDGGDSVGYGLDYLHSECYEQGIYDFDSSCYAVSSFNLDHLAGFNEHDSVITLGHIPQNGINLAKSTFEEYGRSFISPKSFISSMADAGFDNQHPQIGCNSKRRLENRKGAKGKHGRIKRCRGLEPRNGPQEIESTLHRQYSLIDQSDACATFKGQKKKSRRNQHVRHAKLAEPTKTNEKHLDHPKDFSRPKTLAQIKEEKYSSKSNSHPNVHMHDGRSFSGDFEGPKSLSELLKAKGRTSVGK
ncbi:hypothetical protein ACP4OV_006851 [Aristida adscensionis]